MLERALHYTLLAPHEQKFTLIRLLTLLLFTATQGLAGAEPNADVFDDQSLAVRVWALAPSLADARKALVLAEGDAAQSRLLPNPTLSATWGTIPVGNRNPSSSQVSFWDVPNYALGISQNIELGKRGPRQRAYFAFASAQQQEVLNVFRQTFFEVRSAMVDQAAAVVSASEFELLLADSAAGLALQQARADKGDTAGLDVDRLSVEHERLISARDEHLVAQEAALGHCAAVLGGPCPRFAAAAAATAYLETGLLTPAPQALDWQQQRPDLRSLNQQAEGAQALETLGRRRRIPDPTVSLSYMKDTFLLAGNQGQSLAVNVSIPLAVFDHGQVAAHTAREQRRAAEDSSAAVVRSTTLELEHAHAQLALARHRARHLQNEVLPRAQNVLERLQAAAARGGVPLQEVLLARRTLEDLRLERVDIVARVNRIWLDIRLLDADLPHPETLNAASKAP